jgi:hypothetical protein
MSDVSFSSTFCFIAFSGVSQRWEFKDTTKNAMQENSVKKGFYQKKLKKNWLFLDFLYRSATESADFYGVFMRFLTKAVFLKKWGKFCKKLRIFFLVVFSLRFLLIEYLVVSLHEELKNTTDVFSKIRAENLKKPQKKGR